jgi:hypothetical protein
VTAPQYSQLVPLLCLIEEGESRFYEVLAALADGRASALAYSSNAEDWCDVASTALANYLNQARPKGFDFSIWHPYLEDVFAGTVKMEAIFVRKSDFGREPNASQESSKEQAFTYRKSGTDVWWANTHFHFTSEAQAILKLINNFTLANNRPIKNNEFFDKGTGGKDSFLDLIVALRHDKALTRNGGFIEVPSRGFFCLSLPAKTNIVVVD